MTTPMGDTVPQFYDGFTRKGNEVLDFSAIIKMIGRTPG